MTTLEAVTLDFGNTLVPVDRAGLEAVVDATARHVVERCGLPDRDAFLGAWAEERERQFREEVPALREVDLAQRVARVLARLRGMRPPDGTERWDDEAAAALSNPGEVEAAVEAYSAAFVDGMPVPATVEPLLARLGRRGLRLAVLSNWPLAATIDRYCDAAGWTPHLEAIIVSQRVGVVKPHPAIFEAARAALGSPSPAAILHVGDDWSADVVGAQAAGWRTAHVGGRPDDSPLPGSEADGTIYADFELRSLAELESAVDRLLS